MRRLTIVAGLSAALLAGLTAPAAAEPPARATGQVTDEADVLDPADEEEIQQSFDQIEADTGTEVYVVYVDSFDGIDRRQ